MRTALSTALKDAMKAKDAPRLSTLRLINAAIKDLEISARGSEAGDTEITDTDILGILNKMIKQRQQSITAYEEGGRLELAAQEQAEIGVIKEFLPKQMTDDEVSAAVRDVIWATGADSIRDMGRVMGALKAQYTGQMDFGKAGAEVKSALCS